MHIKKYTMGFEIDILAVGKASKGGDAIALRYGNLLNDPIEQFVVVVDGGYTNNGDDLYKLITGRYNTKNIYLVLLTHPDADHVLGLKKLFEYEDIIIQNLMMHCPWENKSVTSATYNDGRITDNSIAKRLKATFSSAYELFCIAKKKGTNIIEPFTKNYNLRGGATFKILGPRPDWYVQKILESDKTPSCDAAEVKSAYFSTDDEFENYMIGENVEWKYDDPHTSPINETSVVALLEFDNNKVLFTGDIGREGLQLAVEEANNQNISLTDLKIFISPHHGSRKNITPELMGAIKASFTILSTPPQGDPHHPSRRMVNKYLEMGHNLFSTNGSSVHWGNNYPERNWKKKDQLTYFDKIEKNA